MEKLLQYIDRTYSPSAVIVYGSFADGTHNAGSDFDALAIADVPKALHDMTVVDGTPLDLWLYPAEAFAEGFNCEEFIQIHDGIIVRDCGGLAARLKAAVNQYLESLPRKTDEENRTQVQWCKKMLHRAARGDAEGHYRWHWLLTDSLEIYCDLRRWHYFGPKKALRLLQKQDPQGAKLYEAALAAMNFQLLSDWIAYLETLCR